MRCNASLQNLEVWMKVWKLIVEAILGRDSDNATIWVVEGRLQPSY